MPYTNVRRKVRRKGNLVKTITYDGHKIEVSISIFAKEEIKYDGKVMSSKYSVTGSTHIFNVIENDDNIQYEVESGIRWHGFSLWNTVRRNGMVIFSDR